MTSADIRFLNHGDRPAWPELADKADALIHLTDEMRVVVIEGGMHSGLPSIALRWDLPDGRVVIAETSARLLNVIARAVLARHPEVEA